jgi:hypothetical protein
MGKKFQEIPAQFSNLMGTGTPVEVYRAKTSTIANSLLAVIFILGSGVSLVFALSIVWDRWGRYYPPAIFKAILPWLIGSVATFGISLLILWRLYNNRKKAAVTYTNGFAYSDRKGVRFWRWDQVQDVTANVVRHYTYGIYTRTTHTYTIQKSSGEKLLLDDSLMAIESFYSHLENNTLQQRYQRMADTYNNGNSVTFGPVTIGKKTGIQIGKKSYPWEDIEEVAIHKGVLSIKKKNGGWFSGATASAGMIPNLQVLLSIINQIVGLKAGK